MIFLRKMYICISLYLARMHCSTLFLENNKNISQSPKPFTPHELKMFSRGTYKKLYKLGREPSRHDVARTQPSDKCKGQPVDRWRANGQKEKWLTKWRMERVTHDYIFYSRCKHDVCLLSKKSYETKCYSVESIKTKFNT